MITNSNIGNTGLKLLPWSRCVGADNDIVKYHYRARLCIEGIPGHVRQPTALAPLFKNSVFIDELDYVKEKPEEESCVCLWAWISDPDGFAKTGTLLEVAEPVFLPEEDYVMSSEDWSRQEDVNKQDSAKLLKYNVIIHLDRVLDYSTPSSSMSHKSVHSVVSGLPDEELEEPWPTPHSFLWRLGVQDGGAAGRRVLAHERLGARTRDESPPRGGGAGRSGGGGPFSNRRQGSMKWVLLASTSSKEEVAGAERQVVITGEVGPQMLLCGGSRPMCEGRRCKTLSSVQWTTASLFVKT
jgi:hypothetical protein